MKREGRPRGMVRTFNILPDPLNPRPASRVVNQVDAVPTAGLFLKISNKPTNHSKFTGKCERPRCNGCHLHPATKSKLKVKGTTKDRSVNNKLDYKVMSWTVMTDDRSDKYPVAGYSASGLIGELYRHDYDSDYDSDCGYDNYDYDYGYGYDDLPNDASITSVVDAVVEEEENEVIVHGGVTADDDDGYQGFFDIGGVLNTQQEESTTTTTTDEDEDDSNEGWTLVGEDL